MKVNKDKKTKKNNNVFTNSACLAKHEKQFYNDTRLEVLNKYYCLGFDFTMKLSCKEGTDHLAAKGENVNMSQ